MGVFFYGMGERNPPWLMCHRSHKLLLNSRVTAALSALLALNFKHMVHYTELGADVVSDSGLDHLRGRRFQHPLALDPESDDVERCDDAVAVTLACSVARRLGSALDLPQGSRTVQAGALAY